MAITYSNLGAAEPSTITNRLGMVSINRGSTAEQQEILVIGDPESSNALARVVDTEPPSTSYGQVVRLASTGVRVINSTQADLRATMYQSTAADLNVTVAGYVAPSTIVTVSTGSVRVHQSTAADLNVTVAGYVAPSTIVTIASFGPGVQSSVVPPGNSSGLVVRPVWSSTNTDQPVSAAQAGTWNVATVTAVTGITNTVTVSPLAGSTFNTLTQLRGADGVQVVASTAAMAVGDKALAVREGLPALLSTTTVITSTHSTALYTLISSAASLRQKVYAYFVGSTHTVPSTLVFLSSNAIDRWHVHFGSGSSGMTGANLALSPPGWIFHTDAANALNVRIEGGSSVASTVIARISIGYFSEP